MDDLVKLIIRSVRETWPNSKPVISTGFFEVTPKDPETFTVLISDPEHIAPLSIGGRGNTYEAALQSLKKNLAIRIREITADAIKKSAEYQDSYQVFRTRLELAADSLEKPSGTV